VEQACGVRNPTFDALLGLIEQEDVLTVVAGDDARRWTELPPCVAPPFAVLVRPGAYIWGFVDEADDLVWQPTRVWKAAPAAGSAPERRAASSVDEEEAEEKEEVARPAAAVQRSESPCDY
jgi:hypothetical protein